MTPLQQVKNQHSETTIQSKSEKHSNHFILFKKYEPSSESQYPLPLQHLQMYSPNPQIEPTKISQNTQKNPKNQEQLK